MQSGIKSASVQSGQPSSAISRVIRWCATLVTPTSHHLLPEQRIENIAINAAPRTAKETISCVETVLDRRLSLALRSKALYLLLDEKAFGRKKLGASGFQVG